MNNPMFNCAFDLTTLSKKKSDFIQDRRNPCWVARTDNKQHLTLCAADFYDAFRRVVDTIKWAWQQIILVEPDEDRFVRTILNDSSQFGSVLKPFVKGRMLLSIAATIAYREVSATLDQEPSSLDPDSMTEDIIENHPPSELTYKECHDGAWERYKAAGWDYYFFLPHLQSVWRQEQPLDTVAVTNHLIENYVDLTVYSTAESFVEYIVSCGAGTTLWEIYGPDIKLPVIEKCARDAWKLAKDAHDLNYTTNPAHSDTVDAVSYAVNLIHSKTLENIMSFENSPVNPAPAHEVKEFIYGQEASTLNDAQLIGYIRSLEQDIASLKEIETKSKAIDAQIKSLENDKAAIVEVLDARVE